MDPTLFQKSTGASRIDSQHLLGNLQNRKVQTISFVWSKIWRLRSIQRKTRYFLCYDQDRTVELYPRLKKCSSGHEKRELIYLGTALPGRGTVPAPGVHLYYHGLIKSDRQFHLDILFLCFNSFVRTIWSWSILDFIRSSEKDLVADGVLYNSLLHIDVPHVSVLYILHQERAKIQGGFGCDVDYCHSLSLSRRKLIYAPQF